jgi:hypothetical protein
LIWKKTVFVLGAGASNPFGLPLGSELFRNVVANFVEGRDRRATLLENSVFLDGQLNQFITDLRYSGLTSVDAFLERRPEYMDIGKAVMAVELISCENPKKLWEAGGNWMIYLYNHMIGNSLEEFSHNKVSFITFNYDRSLEQFLATALSNSFGKSLEECSVRLEPIDIIHLHGRLGYLPWQNAGRSRGYNDTIDKRILDICMNEIKVVHEDIKDRDADFTTAKVLLSKAERVYLLGFGFGARNVERLGLVEFQPGQCAGTAYGMTGKEAAQCKALCGNRPTLFDSLLALEFLRTVAVLD